jgi:hypothetical protein
MMRRCVSLAVIVASSTPLLALRFLEGICRVNRRFSAGVQRGKLERRALGGALTRIIR